MKRVFLITVIAALFINAKAQNFQWTKREGAWAYDYGLGLTNDNAGNVYVAGKYEMNANFSGTILPCQGNHDIYVAKYSPSGTLNWIRTAGGTSGDYAKYIACDGANFLYVAGEIEGFGNTVKFLDSPVTLICQGVNDAFLAKYDLSGNLLWALRAGGIDNDEALGVTYDKAGNVYICGFFNKKATFGTTTITGYGGYDIFVAKYDRNGNFLWVRKAGGADKDEARYIKCDTAGNVYVCGMFTGPATFGSQTINSPNGYSDAFLAKYDPDGNLTWVKAFGGDYDDAAWSMAMDNEGKIYVTGEFNAYALFGSIPLITVGNSDIFIACIDASGNVLWAKRAGGKLIDRARGIGSDGTNTFITGQFGDTASFGAFTLYAADSSDIFIAALNNSGDFSWATSAGGTADTYEPQGFESGAAICAEASGNVYATGAILNGAVFGNTTLTNYDRTDVFITKVQNTNAPPVCQIPNGLSTESITATSVLLKWIAVNSALTYDVRYRKTGITSWTTQNANSNSLLITGLASFSNYEFQVKTNCSFGVSTYSTNSIFTTSGTANTELIPAGSSWKYLDNGTNQGSTWKAPSFDDSTWKTGNAEFGYGDNDETTLIGFGSNASNKYITTYFRKNFTIDLLSKYSSFELSLLKDDGAVVYVNGQEVLRTNMPAGTISNSTLALSSIGTPGEAAFTPYTISSSKFVTGANTLAVEVHQSYPGSPDLSFNLKLKAFTSTVSVCEVPTNLSSTVTSTSATLSWASVNAAISYDVQYRVNGSTSWTFLNTNTNTNSISLSGLTASSNYEFQVKTNCPSGGSIYSAITSFTTSGTVQVELIASGSSWKYLDNGTNQGSAWKGISFVDSTWQTGNAELGYGDGGETTVVGYGSSPTNKYITTYFRKTFNVTDKSTFTGLELSLLRDDGAVVYINGTEVYRTNLPSGTIYFNTLAPAYIDGANESTYLVVNVGSSSLVNGTNLIAVEIHQNAVTSSDISFNLKLRTLNGNRLMDTIPAINDTQQATISENNYDMIVYPNPSTGLFNLELCIDALEEKTLQIEVSNSLGQVVFKKRPKKINNCVNEVIELDSALPIGVYIMKVMINDKIETKKMLLTR